MKSTDFLKEHNAFIAQDADEMHRDQEVQMARADLYNAADYAIKLHKILRGVNDTADMEQWVLEKIAIANENLRTVYEYMNYEAKEQEGALPAFAFESAEKQFDEILEEDWKKALAGGALAASMALGGGAAHADEAPRDVPAASIKADMPTTSRYTQGVEYPAAYTLSYKGQEYKFAGREAEAPKGGERVTVGAGAIGIRGLKPTEVILAKDGKYYIAPMDEGYDMDQLRRDAESSLKANIDKQSDDRIAKAKEPKPGFFQQVGQKQIGMVKGAIKGASKGLRGEQFQESMSAGATGAGGFATGPVANAAPMQRRVKKESARYANAMKTKEPKLGKGVY